MNTPPFPAQESPQESLDPEDWDALRALAGRMLDDAFAYLRDVRERPVWRAMPEHVAGTFQAPAPRGPEGAEAVYQQFSAAVLPYAMGNIHPRFWAWVMGNGGMTGALAEFLAAVMNSNAAGGNHAAVRVERQVIDWIKAMLGFPATASGLLTSGASMANLIGLAVARDAGAGFDVREAGMAAAPQPLVAYASSEAHSSNGRALELLGLGRAGLRRIPARDDFTFDVAALEAAIAADRAAGLRPLCVIGSAGTVNTGAIDDLAALAALCRREGLWFHVDGAIGAVAVLADSVRPRLAGIERADSIALDLHKWMHMPFEAGCVLVRDADAHHRAFAMAAEYLEPCERGLAGDQPGFHEYGVQTSRQFRALKVWMTVKEHGLDRFGRLIARNVEQARALGARVTAEPRLELLAPVSLNIVCFRYNPGGQDDASLNRLNREIMIRLQEEGTAAVSDTLLGGRRCLRAAIVNYRSRDEDFALLAREVVRLGSLIGQA